MIFFWLLTLNNLSCTCVGVLFFFFWRWTVDFYLTSQTHCCSMNPHFSPTIHENVVLFFNFFKFFRNESYLPFCALSKLYLMLYRGYFSVLQTVNCSFAFLETYFCTWLIPPPCLAYFNWSSLSRNWSCQPHENLFGICRVLVQTFYPIMLQLRRCQQKHVSLYCALYEICRPLLPRITWMEGLICWLVKILFLQG